MTVEADLLTPILQCTRHLELFFLLSIWREGVSEISRLQVFHTRLFIFMQKEGNVSCVIAVPLERKGLMRTSKPNKILAPTNSRSSVLLFYSSRFTDPKHQLLFTMLRLFTTFEIIVVIHWVVTGVPAQHHPARTHLFRLDRHQLQSPTSGHLGALCQ